MRKRVQIVLAVVLVAFAGVSAWQGLREREPLYQGRRLSVWLEAYGTLPGRFGTTAKMREAQQKAHEAVRQAGTNAIPLLLRMLAAKDSSLKVKLMDLVKRQHFIQIHLTPAKELNIRAAAGFHILHTVAKDAVPALMEIANQSISPSRSVISALGSIGPSAREAVPFLLRCATNADPWVRYQAVASLGGIHGEPGRVVPVLINALHDPSSDVQNQAIQQLRFFGKDAKVAVPALVEFLDTSHDDVNKLNAIGILKEIDRE